MPEDDAVFCARMLRHATIGALLGGPVVAAFGWSVYARMADRELATRGGMLAAVAVIALLLGTWLGATLSCLIAGREPIEDKCYGGTAGCFVYLVGGVLGLLLSRVYTGLGLHPVVWYLAGGTVSALIAMVVAWLSPRGRCSMKPTGKPEP